MIVDSDPNCLELGLMLRKAFGMVVISGCLLAWAGCAQNTGGGPGIDGGHGQDLAPACNGMVCIPGCACMTGLKCDPSSKTCVQCLTNGDCAAGSVCDPTAHTCGAGCAANQPCAPDGGKCDLDGGVCVQCLGDNDCLDPANGHCNPATHKCAPCVPSNDTCGYGTYCGTTMNGNLDCIPGCKNDTDCLPARPAPMPDLKMSPLDMTAPPSDMTAPPSDGAVCMMNDAGACVIPDGGAPTDLSSPTDLSRPGDLASPRDLLTPPDLAPVDNAPRCDTKVHTCVRCLIDNDCPPGRVCKAEQCVPGCTDLHACNGALACCMDQCTDTTSDSQNCGNCGNICQGGWNCCGSACSNPVKDVNNCGSCGNACKAQNGTPTCTARACAIAKCNPGWADCNGVVMDGCETHTDVNPNSCGSCGNTCYFPHASSKCLGGVCAVDTCASGFGNCDMDPNDANGCETNTNTDPMNCGGCAMTCSTNNISPACSLGMCSGTCVTGFADCNGDKRTDGCEANLGTDPMNCGSCGTNCAKQCALNVAATTCTSGTCGITACQPGFYDLDGQCANGCECQAMPPSGGTCAMPAA